MLKRFIILFLFLMFVSICFSLKITELYYDWTDEWIELYNDSNTAFSWTISLQWVKSTNLNLSINFLSNQFVIIWDSLSNILNKSNCFTWKWLNISDSSPANIYLYNSWILLDSFLISEELIKKFDNKQTSINKIFTNTWFYISWTSLSHAVNNINNFIINPYKILYQTWINVQTWASSSSNINTWTVLVFSGNELTWNASSSATIIDNNVLETNEINPFDSDFVNEYIIIHFKKDYSWKIYFEWLWTSNTMKYIDIKAFSGSNLLITDEKKLLSEFQNIIILDSISLNDNWECINIKWENEIIFEKLCYSNWIRNSTLTFTKFENDIKQFGNIWNISAKIDFSKFICSVEKIDNYNYNLNVLYNWNNYVNNMLIKQFSWNVLLSTWAKIKLFDANMFVNIQVDFIDQHVCSTYFSYVYNKFNEYVCKDETINWILKFTEINPDIKYFPEYVELKAYWNYSWVVVFSWLLVWDKNIQLPINLLSWDYLILTKNNSWFNDISKIKLVDNMSLLNSWEKLVVFGQDGQALDSVLFDNSIDWNALYLGDSFSWVRLFDRQWSPTPWYSGHLLNYCMNWNIQWLWNNCSINIQNSTSFYYWNSINLQWIFNDKVLINNIDYQCNWYVFTGLVLTWCNPWYYKPIINWIVPIKLEIYSNSNLICSTQMQLNYPVKLISSSSSSENYYFQLYHKYKDLYNFIKKNNQNIFILTWESSDKIDNISKIKLYSILPNPKWSDKNNESIKLINNDLTGVYLNDFYIKVNNKQFNLTWLLNIWKIYQLTWNFAMKNQSWCVELNYNSIKVDSLCYSWVKTNDIVYSKFLFPSFSNSSIVLSTNNNEDKSNIIKTKSTIKKISSLYNREKKKFEKTLKKSEKNELSYQKKLDKLNKQIITYKEKLSKEKQKYINYKSKIINKINKINQRVSNLWLKIKWYILKIKQLKQDYKIKFTIISDRMKLTTNYINYVNSILKNNWQIIYNQEKFEELKSIYKIMDLSIKNNKQYFYLYWINFSKIDIKNIFELNIWKISLNTMLKSYISNNIDIKIKSFNNYIK